MKLEELKKKGQKPKDSFLAVLIYRKISIRITRYLLPTKITPNQVTVFSFLLTLLAAILFSTGIYTYLIFGAILLQFGYILDCVDGEIAKIKNLKSKAGALLDEVLDCAGYIVILSGVGYGIYFATHNVWTLVLVLFAASGLLMMSVVNNKILNLGIEGSSWEKIEKKIGASRFHLSWGGGIDELILAIAAITNQLFIALIIISFGANANWIVRFFLNLRKEHRE